jgi:hypothetical protein
MSSGIGISIYTNIIYGTGSSGKGNNTSSSGSCTISSGNWY